MISHWVLPITRSLIYLEGNILLNPTNKYSVERDNPTLSADTSVISSGLCMWNYIGNDFSDKPRK